MFLIQSLLDLIFYLLVILLFVRYFVDEQSMFAFGPMLQMLQQVTDPFIKPIRRVIIGSAPRYHTFAPFVALIGVILLHGMISGMLTTLAARSFLSFGAILLSFEKAADVLFMFVVAMLFASTMLSKSGFTIMTSAGFRAFQEGTFKAFRLTRALLHTDRVWSLFWGSVAWLLLLHFVFVSAVSLRVLLGGSPIYHELYFIVHATGKLLDIYWFVLLVAIVASWLTMAGAGGDIPMVRGVRALAEPFFRMFRLLFKNKLRWGVIDFSPIVAFLILAIVRQVILNNLELSMLQNL